MALRISPLFVSLFAVVLSFTTQAATVSVKPVDKSERIKRLRAALDRQNQDEAREAGALQKKVKIDNYKNKAYEELTVPTPSYSNEFVPTSATVQTQELSGDNFVRYDGLQLALKLQPYSPKGVIPMAGIPDNNLNALPSQTMTGLGLRYMPWTLTFAGEPLLGVQTTVSYAQNRVSLFGPTGVNLGDTRLHTIFSQAYFSSEWTFSSISMLSLTLDAGIAHLDLVQSGKNSLANQSDSRWLSVLEFGPQIRTGDWWWNVKYQYRSPISGSRWAQMETSSFEIGLLYGLR